MNAYKIMVFILLFSFSVTIVTGLNIYSSSGNVHPEGINFTDGEVTNYETWDVLWGLMGRDLTLAVVSGAIAGAIAKWIAGVPGDRAFLYSSFVTFYLAKTAGAIQVFWAIAQTAAQHGTEIKTAILVGVIIFSAVVALSLFSFLMQLIGGPWQSME